MGLFCINLYTGESGTAGQKCFNTLCNWIIGTNANEMYLMPTVHFLTEYLSAPPNIL